MRLEVVLVGVLAAGSVVAVQFAAAAAAEELEAV